jgi:hypothetical protein
MTEKQWNALERMTWNKYNTNFFSSLLSVGEVTLTKVLEHYVLEYPTHSVTLKKDKSVSGTDLHYLRYLYNEYLSSMSI